MSESRKPVFRPVVSPVTFTPFAGLMECAKRLTQVVERRAGISLWDGEDGVSGVASDILRGFGVSEKPIPLGTSEHVISPRIVAERCGLIKRRRPKRRLS